MKLHICSQAILCVIIAFSFLACTSPQEKIKRDMKLHNEQFLSSDKDYNIVDSKVYMYDVGDSLNYLADKSVRDIASDYADNKGAANRSRNEADKQRNSNRLTDSDWNPNWSQIARSAEYDANVSDSIADIYKRKIQTLNFANIQAPKGGIWVFHEIEYKEYLYKCFAGPYVKRYLYLYSSDGERLQNIGEVFYDSHVFQELLDLTHTQYEILSE